jgi:hypothetical protein
MMTLEDARRWYETTKRHLKLFGRVGEKHWNDLPWDGALGRDVKLKALDADAIVEGVEFCLKHLDDLAIQVLFSAFESVVRDQVLSTIEEEIKDKRKRQDRPLVIQVLDEARQETKRGRILRVLGFFKNQDASLVEKVNQVRRYRNWVAHGRRTIRPAAVDPTEAYERLKEFLDRFAPTIPDER